MGLNILRWVLVAVVFATSSDGVLWENVTTTTVNEMYYIGYDWMLDERLCYVLACLEPYYSAKT